MVGTIIQPPSSSIPTVGYLEFTISRQWWHKPLISALERQRQEEVLGRSRPAWSTEQVAGQLGIHKKKPCLKNIKNNKLNVSIHPSTQHPSVIYICLSPTCYLPVQPPIHPYIYVYIQYVLNLAVGHKLCWYLEHKNKGFL